MTDKKCILFVEDDEELRKRIQLLLARGYRVEEAVDGHEGLQKARGLTPSLIILDVVLPKMSGMQVSRLLKFDEKFKGIPIIMVTVLDQPAQKEQGKSVGATLYLTKPFSDEDLLKAVQALI